VFSVCSHLKKVRSIAYKCGTNKARPAGPGPNCDTICSPFVLFEKINVQAKKRYRTPHPKKILARTYIYYTSKNFSKFRGFNESCAGEVLCAPWIQLSSFLAFSG
jgi:hypothetical protein